MVGEGERKMGDMEYGGVGDESMQMGGVGDDWMQMEGGKTTG